MDKKEKIAASLEKNLPAIQSNRPITLDKDVKEISEKSIFRIVFRTT